MSDPPRRQVSWRVPRSVPVRRRSWQGPAWGVGVAAVVVLIYLGWSWQPFSPRGPYGQMANRLASTPSPLEPTESDSDKADDVAELLDEAEPDASPANEPAPSGLEPPPSEPPSEHDEPDAALPEELAMAAGSPLRLPPLPPLPPAPVVLAVPPPRHEPPRGAPGELGAPVSETAEHGGAEDEPPTQRQVQVLTLSRWQNPGLCTTNTQAARARELMMRRFRVISWDDDARLFFDPRLMLSTRSPLIKQLEAAENEVMTQLAITPRRPDVFAYRDTKLLLAASCANADVVAYYDGALHVVPSQDDVAQSVVHEYTHHALTSAGVVGPAWAHEGIAMLVARETWWQRSEWLERVAERPFALEDMESTVPYTLTSEQATLFYVQAAAMVACAIHEQPGGLESMVRELAAGSRGVQVSYELPSLADPRYFRACTRTLLD
jgi:hypothetical protein